MKVNKLFCVKSITNLIYGLLLMLPFASVLSRTIYVQANPNAKDSYSDSYITKINTITNSDNLISGEYYYLSYQEQTGIGNSYSPHFKYNSININWSSYFPSLDNSIVKYFDIRWDFTNNHSYLYLRDENNVMININGTNAILIDKWGTDITQIYFNYNSLVDSANLNKAKTILQQSLVVKNDLDNAFEYSLKTFTDENNVDSIDFFGWFTNLFLNQENSHNQIYLGFANWYMNYTLLVSAGYLLFFALLWFINYVRKILEKSSYHDFGGF